MENYQATGRSEVLKWLHLSDAHIGMQEQRTQWSRPARKLQEDLSILLDKIGGIDLIIFSGDLTQAASQSQFQAFSEEIIAIQSCASKFSESRPPLITVPGNHDMEWPSSTIPEAAALKNLLTNQELRDQFWDEAGIPYREFLKKCFSNYNIWLEEVIASGIHLAPEKTGYLPGDATYSLKTTGGTTGVFTLNSTWLQLNKGDYRGKLHIDPAQLLSMLEHKSDDQLDLYDANLLVSHHPVDWLHSTSQEGWARDINPAGRFDLHLFGHMHEHKAVTEHYSGSHGQSSIQACSLFGIEWRAGASNRSQGYSAGAITSGVKRIFECWPRKITSVAGGDIKFAPDITQNLDERSNSYKISLPERLNGKDRLRSSTEINSVVNRTQGPPQLTSEPKFDLLKIRRPALAERGHLSVRRIEQNAVLASIKSRKIFWLSTEWGLGEEEFASCIEKQLTGSGVMYTMDMTGFRSKTQFLDGVKETLGASFQTIAEAVSNAGPCLVLFSGIELERSDEDKGSRQRDIEGIAQAFSDFAPEAYFLLVTRTLPRASTYGTTELRPLDEADLAVYLKEANVRSGDSITPALVSTIMRHTDGIPGRIDLALRELEVGSVEDLAPSNPDLAPSAMSVVAAPAALINTVSELKSSETRQERRAYDLLLALSGLPQGEQISRLKRFFGGNPIMTGHAIELVNRSLVKTRPVSSNNSKSSDEKILVVPKVVRDYIRESIGPAKSRSLDRKALELYFGESWATGDISNSFAAKKIGEALCDGYEIQNMSTLAFRAVTRAIESHNDFDLSGTIRLSIALISLLTDNSHYRSAASLSEDMLGLLSEIEGHTADMNLIRTEYAESLRMLGRSEEAIKIFEGVDRKLLSKERRLMTELHMALCYERLDQVIDAKNMANELIKSSPKSASANHARAILANLTEESTERVASLKKILETARKNRQYTIANNIILNLAEELEDVDEARNLLRKALIDSKHLSIYTVARLVVKLAQLPDAPEWISAAERSLLIEAYYYLYNERLLTLFANCHSALWNIFEKDGDNFNLLNLFRHSSFVWRLSDKDELEIKYLHKLASNAPLFVASDDNLGEKNKAYLIVRIAVVLGEESAKRITP